jgi:hypothetical protein
MIAPAGSISLAQERFRVTIADCASFRLLVGASDRSSAFAHLYHEGLPEPANGTEYTRTEFEALRPWGIVFTSEQSGFRRRTISTGGFRSAGRLKLRLCRTCPATIDGNGQEVPAVDVEPSSDAAFEWKNILGQIIAELCEFSVAGDTEHLVFEEISLDFGPFASAPELAATQGVWQGAELSVQWGGQ